MTEQEPSKKIPLGAEIRMLEIYVNYPKHNPEEIVKHIKYVVEKIGINHVALGSDFDRADMPEGLKDVSGLPKLITELQKTGYGSEAINKITYKNWLRVIKATWKS